MDTCVQARGDIMAMKRFIDITDFTREELRETLNQITYLSTNASIYAKELEGKVIALAFYEENLLVENSFRCAVAKMGGSVISFRHIEGMSLKDEALSLSAVCDAIVVYHPLQGAARAFSMYATVPVINAGDGGRAFPVRTLADVSSIWLEKKHVSNMRIGFLGDFSDNACVKNLLQCMNLYKGNEFSFISVNGKPLSDDYVALIDKREKLFSVYDNLFDVLPELDVLYLTRVDKSMFDSEIMYESRKHNFTLDERMLLAAKQELLIMHAFPRGEELDSSVDSDPRASYIKNMSVFTLACQISLIKTVTNKASRNIIPSFDVETHDEICKNEKCITNEQTYLPHLYHELSDGRMICKYCSKELKK